jgi:dipeptidyl aminopeptidase/acylaminoacyl peptidase
MWVNRRSLFVFVIVAWSGAVAFGAQDQGAPQPAGESTKPVRRFLQATIAPDGRRLAWVEEIEGAPGGPGPRSAIFVSNVAGSASPRQITAGDGRSAHAEHSLAWSPDSQRLAFLSDHDQAGQVQLYVAQASGGEAKRLTALQGALASPQWSPDGRRLGFLFTEGTSDTVDPLKPGEAPVGVIDETILVQRLSVLDLDSGRVRPVSPGGLFVFEFDWSPDSRQCGAIAAYGPGNNAWYTARIFAFDIETGEHRLLLDPKMQIALPRWSPDGRTIAFIGGVMSDEGSAGGDIFLMPADGGPPRNLTPDLKATVRWLNWDPSGEKFLIAEQIDGHTALATVHLDGRVTTLWKGPIDRIAAIGRGTIVSIAVARDQKTSALIHSSFREPPEIWAGPIGDWHAVTNANRDIHPDWGQIDTLTWQSEPFPIQGWLLYPKDYSPERRYPMIVSVHGGPSSGFLPSWLGSDSLAATLSSAGYFVLMPNPRGSYGQGEVFTRANIKDIGHGDLRDIMKGVDEVLKAKPVDPGRLGITGTSYGGYMTMWAVTQTQRFVAAVTVAGISNWQSYYGQNGIDQWVIPFFGTSVYDDPAIYSRSAPITFIKQVRTPTLVLVGERDVECPVPQSQEFYHALKTLGVTTQMVIYAGEGHQITKPEHRADMVRRSLAWFDRFLKPERLEKRP